MPQCYECEQCGTSLNVNSNDTKCPNCGAPIKNENAKKEKELVTSGYDN